MKSAVTHRPLLPGSGIKKLKENERREKTKIDITPFVTPVPADREKQENAAK